MYKFDNINNFGKNKENLWFERNCGEIYCLGSDGMMTFRISKFIKNLVDYFLTSSALMVKIQRNENWKWSPSVLPCASLVKASQKNASRLAR